MLQCLCVLPSLHSFACPPLSSLAPTHFSPPTLLCHFPLFSVHALFSARSLCSHSLMRHRDAVFFPCLSPSASAFPAPSSCSTATTAFQAFCCLYLYLCLICDLLLPLLLPLFLSSFPRGHDAILFLVFPALLLLLLLLHSTLSQASPSV